MLNLNQIEQYYQKSLRAFRKNILREYLQYKILEIIFNSKLAAKFSFLGGTALRIIYGNTRFSEDLDFDNFNLSQQEFSLLSNEIENGLKKEGYNAEIRNVFKGAYRCYIKIPKIMFNYNLSGIEGEKIMIQVDTDPHNFEYQPDKKILNKFDVFTQAFVTPLNILLSQKIFAVLNRKRAKGRDFYDIIFLLQRTKPNYDYLDRKVGLQNGSQLRKKLIAHVKNLDLRKITRDVEPFLFNPSDSKKIKLFGEFIKQAELD